MQVILICAEKGGAGKTTLARNLCVAAAKTHRVLAIDLDPQGSLRRWWNDRESSDISMLESDPTPQQLSQRLQQALKSAQVDLVVVDTPPAANGWLMDAMTGSSLVLMPVRPTPDDLHAVARTARLADKTGVPWAFVLSQALTRSRLTNEAVRTLAARGRLAPAQTAPRVSYAETAATGQGVQESGDQRAAQEIDDLWAFVSDALNQEK